MTDAYRFIAAEKANYPISLMSRVLGVSRQAFHAWERRPPSQRSLKDAFPTELAAVQDAFSRRIVGWAMAEHMRSELVVDALQMGLARRRPEAGLIHHSDQGSQYVSLTFDQRARDAGIAVSMGSRGDCFDNAVAESFFATLKKELVHRGSWPTRREMQSAVFDYIESFYNRERRHSTLGYLSPREFEMISIYREKEGQGSNP